MFTQHKILTFSLGISLGNVNKSTENCRFVHIYYRSGPPEVFLGKSVLKVCSKPRCSENIQQIYRRTPLPKRDFNKVAKQLY